MKKILMFLAVSTMSISLKGQSQCLSTKSSELLFYTLPYSFEAIEPAVDRATVEIHHTKHHRAYFDNFMKAIAGTELSGKTLQDIFSNTSNLPDAIRNNAGGYYNHILYWEILKPDGRGKLADGLKFTIDRDFGSLDELKRQLTDASLKRFGSGWTWLSVDSSGKLFVSSTANQDNPLMDVVARPGFPILGIDVWEHAYYLKYQNRRAEYVNLILNAINWEAVSALYESIKK